MYIANGNTDNYKFRIKSRKGLKERGSTKAGKRDNIIKGHTGKSVQHNATQLLLNKTQVLN